MAFGLTGTSMGRIDHPYADGAVERCTFVSTAWSLVLAAAEGSDRSPRALESLCQLYWYPLYAFLRRRGHPPHDAEDLIQGFFLIFLRRNDVSRVRPEKGRFRSFLLTALNHHVLDERARTSAAKRGGGRANLPLDLETAETRYSLEPAHEDTAERLFERRWALAIVNHALDNVRERYASEGKGNVFEALKHSLTDQGARPGHRAAALQLGMSEAAVKVAAHRLRRRFGDLLRSAVADTVEREDEVDDELQSLLAALRP